MPIGGSCSRSEWVAPKIFRAKDKVFWGNDWWQSTLVSPYQLSQQTISGNKAYYIMMKGFGQGAFSRKDETDLFCPECEGDAC